MESAETLKNSSPNLLTDWLTNVCGLSCTLTPLKNDASFRRYFRVQTPTRSYVAMDASGAQESCHAYIAIANALRKMGLYAPEIVHADLTQRYLLLTDFGNQTYLSTLNSSNAASLYKTALDALAIFQACQTIETWSLPLFDANFMQQEWTWFKEWCCAKFLKLPLLHEATLNACYEQIVQMALQQPQVFMYRDFHSANLMVLPNQQVGLLDFQDAFKGPLTYDLVSLLKDCYIAWPKAEVHSWVGYYQTILQTQGSLAPVTPLEFLRWFDWMGVERHFKALFTFTRKAVRDQDKRYLQYIPQTLAYLIEACASYPELKPLHAFLVDSLQPAFHRVSPSCVA